MFKRLINLFSLFFFICFGYNCYCAELLVIGILQTVEHPALDETYKGIKDTIEQKAHDLGIKVLYDTAQGDANLAFQIAQKFISQNPKVIVTIGTMASQACLKLTKNNHIPVVFSSITDPVGAGLVKDLRNTGTNFTGVGNFVPLEYQLKIFKKILPTLKRLGVIYNAGEENSVKILNLLQEEVRKFDIELVSVAVNKSAAVSSAAYSLSKKVDAIFISHDNTVLSAMKVVIRAATNNKIPVFCGDIDTIGIGVMVAIGPDQYQLGKETAEMVLEILAGKSLKELPVTFPKEVKLYLNLKSAREIGHVFSEEVLKQADKIVG